MASASPPTPAADRSTTPTTRIETTTPRATALGGHTDVVWVDGHRACIALTHIDVTPGGAA